METIVKEKYESETLSCVVAIEHEPVEFMVCGQTIDRTYEDRDVHFCFHESGWLKAEDAIALGQMLVKHGTRAFLANMFHHQLIHHYRELQKFLKGKRIEKVIMTMVDEHPANHGAGFRTYLVKPQWKPKKAPKYQEDFQFETIIYWSPFPKEYERQLKHWGNHVEFVGYDHDAEVAEFHRMCAEMSDTPDDGLVVGREPSKVEEPVIGAATEGAEMIAKS